MRRSAVLFDLLLLGLSLGLWLGEPRLVSAQGAPAADEASTRARQHYERGVGLFDEGRFDAALAEFEAAYALSPRPSLLFNVAQIHARLGHAVEATETFERYLAEATDLTAERRALVDTELETQRSRIGSVRVEARAAGAPLEGAMVSLDDASRGLTPLEGPLRVSAGEHVLIVRAEGHEAASERFRIAGGQERTVVLELVRVVARDTEPGGGEPTTPAPRSAPVPALTIAGSVIGGLGLVTWAVTGLITVLEAQGLTSGAGACSPACPPERLATIDVTRVVADVSLGVMAVGAILAIVGAVTELGGSGDERAPVALGAAGLELWW